MQMRRWPTPEEKEIWRRLWTRRSTDPSFRWCSQAVLYGRIADFWCPSARLIVELDGRMHDPIADAERDLHFAGLKIQTLRFRNAEVRQEPSLVFQKIVDAWRARLDRGEESAISQSAARRAANKARGEVGPLGRPQRTDSLDGSAAGASDTMEDLDYVRARLAEVRQRQFPSSLEKVMQQLADVATLERLLDEGGQGTVEVRALEMLVEPVPANHVHLAPYCRESLERIIHDLGLLRHGLIVRTTSVFTEAPAPRVEAWEPQGDGMERCVQCAALLEGGARGRCLLCRRKIRIVGIGPNRDFQR